MNAELEIKVIVTTPPEMAAIFNEWAARYAAKPEDFGPILDAEGNPISDYGENCAHYFEKIASELNTLTNCIWTVPVEPS